MPSEGGSPAPVEAKATLEESLGEALKKERGKEFPPDFLAYLQAKHPDVHKELAAANAAAQQQEVGYYTKAQLEQVDKLTRSFAMARWVADMEGNGVKDAKDSYFSWAEDGTMLADVPTAFGDIEVARFPDGHWTVWDVPYHTDSEEVFEDVAMFQDIIGKMQRGELVSKNDKPFVVNAAGATLFFDGSMLNNPFNPLGNTMEAENAAAIAAKMNAIHELIAANRRVASNPEVGTILAGLPFELGKTELMSKGLCAVDSDGDPIKPDGFEWVEPEEGINWALQPEGTREQLRKDLETKEIWSKEDAVRAGYVTLGAEGYEPIDGWTWVGDPPAADDPDWTLVKVPSVETGEVALESSVASGSRVEAKTDKVREQAREHAADYMDGTKDDFKFKVAKDSKEELKIRIEDLLNEEADKTRVLTSSRPEYAGVEFTFDANGAKGPSWYATDGRRLLIYADDQITTKKEESTPPPAESAPATVEAAPAESAPAQAEELDEETVRKAMSSLRAIHVLLDNSARMMRAIDQNGETRESHPEEWKQVDALYSSIIDLSEGLPPLDKIPQDTDEAKRLVAEATIMQKEMPQRLAALKAPASLMEAGVRLASKAKEATDSGVG